VIAEPAQARMIALVVRDAATGQPVVGAAVSLPTLGLATATAGRVKRPRSARASGTVEGLPLRVSAHGYELAELSVTPDGPSELRVEVSLRPSPVRLNEAVVVTPQREGSLALDVPRSLSLLEPRDFERRMPRTTPEALTDATGVLVQKTNHGGGSPIIRGLVAPRAGAVDGIRLNNSTFRYGRTVPATVDLRDRPGSSCARPRLGATAATPT
jgi:hypothetical protein